MQRLSLVVTATASAGPPQDFASLCMRKDALARPPSGALSKHAFALQGAAAGADLAAYMHSVVDLSERLLSLAQMFVAHYYQLFDLEPNLRWANLAGLYAGSSVVGLVGRRFRGPAEIEQASKHPILNSARPRVPSDAAPSCRCAANNVTARPLALP